MAGIPVCEFRLVPQGELEDGFPCDGALTARWRALLLAQGFLYPISARADGHVLWGRELLAAARELGIAFIPCMVTDSSAPLRPSGIPSGTAGFTAPSRRRAVATVTEARNLGAVLGGGLPEDGTDWRILSFCNISAIAFVRYVAEVTPILSLSVSTFRVGPRALKLLNSLCAGGKLLNARFIVGRLQQQDHRKSSATIHYEHLERSCLQNGWRLAALANHTKLTLMDTALGKFVVEGSSNLNEAPNWEQFCFTKDDALYDFYAAGIDEMFRREEASDGGNEKRETGEGAPWVGNGRTLSW